MPRVPCGWRARPAGAKLFVACDFAGVWRRGVVAACFASITSKHGRVPVPVH